MGYWGKIDNRWVGLKRQTLNEWCGPCGDNSGRVFLLGALMLEGGERMDERGKSKRLSSERKSKRNNAHAFKRITRLEYFFPHPTDRAVPAHSAIKLDFDFILSLEK